MELINAPTQTAELAVLADGALFAAAPEVLADPATVTNIVAHLRLGAVVAAGGWKMPSPWLWPLRALVGALHSPYLAGVTGLERPWRLLADHVPDLRISERGFGPAAIVAAGARLTITVFDRIRPHDLYRRCAEATG